MSVWNLYVSEQFSPETKEFVPDGFSMADAAAEWRDVLRPRSGRRVTRVSGACDLHPSQRVQRRVPAAERLLLRYEEPCSCRLEEPAENEGADA